MRYVNFYTSVHYICQLALKEILKCWKFYKLTFYSFGKLLRGVGKITCQTFASCPKLRKKYTFQNGAPFIFVKVFISTPRMPVIRAVVLLVSRHWSYFLEGRLWSQSRRWENSASQQWLLLEVVFDNCHFPREIMWDFFYLWRSWGEDNKRIRNFKLQGKIYMWKAINILFTLLSRCSLSDIYYTVAIYIFNHCPLIDTVKYFWIRHLGFVCALKLSFVL